MSIRQPSTKQITCGQKTSFVSHTGYVFSLFCRDAVIDDSDEDPGEDDTEVRGFLDTDQLHDT